MTSHTQICSAIFFCTDKLLLMAIQYNIVPNSDVIYKLPPSNTFLINLISSEINMFHSANSASTNGNKLYDLSKDLIWKNNSRFLIINSRQRLAQHLSLNWNPPRRLKIRIRIRLSSQNLQTEVYSQNRL
jgi:hypothetical protein